MTTQVSAPPRVNVLDFGAVADGVTDCTEAFQNAVDVLGHDTGIGGGVVFVPAAPNITHQNDDGTVTVTQGRYRLTRSVIVDKNNVRIVGEDRARSIVVTATGTPAFIFGLYRGTPRSSLSPGHWVDLGQILDSTATQSQPRTGYRTVADGERCTISLPASPFTLGPTDAAGRIPVDNWGSVTQLTLDFVVQHNDPGPWLDGQPLFGMVDFDGRPAPWYAQIRVFGPTTSVRFCFRTTDGLYRELAIPFDGSQPLLRCSLQLDLAAPDQAAAWVGHTPGSPALGQVAVDTSRLNDGATGLKFVANDASPFQLGTLSPYQGSAAPAGGINVPGPQQDLTFAALRLTAAPRYVVEDLTKLGPTDPPPPKKNISGRPINDLDLLLTQDGGFAALPMDEQVRLDAGRPDFTVPWYSSGWLRGYGLLVSDNIFDLEKGYGANISGNGVENLTVVCGIVTVADGKIAGVGINPYSQAIALGLVYDFAMTDVHVVGGAQGLGSYHLGVGYPVTLRSCKFESQTETAIYANQLMLNAGDLKIGPFGRSVLTAVRSSLAIRDVFVGNSSLGACDTPVRLYDSSGQFDNVIFDTEGTVIQDSYFRATLAPFVGGPTQLVIRDCQSVLGSQQAVAVRLVSADRNAGIATPGRNAGWCSIERSFTTFLDPGMRAVVAVDGPLWQGTFTGIPPGRPELVVTTAEPGASARIGLGTLPPPAVSVPAPAAADPIPALPGLVGYYRADGAQNLDDKNKPVPAREGQTVHQLADHTAPARVGTLAPGTPSAVYRADAINGLPALSFAQGYYTFPAAPTTTGSATVFLVSRGQPYLQTANLWLAGHYWGVANTTGYGTSVDAATSDSDWIVHAFRYTVRPVPAGAPAGTLPARVLQTWANGQLYATQRFDHAADVAWTSFSIGNNGASLFTGELSTAVFFNAALGDDQVDLVNRYLLHRHQIAV